MKKLIVFLTGVILIALMFGALVVSGAIYQTGGKATVETFFFQPNNLFFQRQTDPKSVQDLSSDELRNMLLNKYITEYFYVTPDVDELERRKSGQTTLRSMSTNAVFDAWLKNVAPDIEEMTDKKMLRMASLVSATMEPGSDKYWRVKYQLKTWARPNDLAATPEIKNGEMYMQIFFEPDMREKYKNPKEVIKYLEEKKGDPVALFKFGIVDITTQGE